MNWNREDWELEREVMKALGWDVSCNLYTSGNERINRFFLVDPNGLEYVEIRGVP
ncbi:MAG TPA: hypothetical protein VJ044_08400 [Candidatus Hodarchaeales archaeon]|nr:hypothetical protein [Candidatus Hodarchaeales archaeon]